MYENCLYVYTLISLPWSLIGDEEEELDEMELRKRIAKAERNLDRIEADLERRKEEYYNYLQQGAEANSRARQAYAVRARLEKFKARVQELERIKTVRNLTLWELAKGQREIQSLLDEIESDIDAEFTGVDVDGFQEQIDEMRAEVEAEMRELSDLMQGLEMQDLDIPLGTSEEQEMMEAIATEEMDVEDIEEQVDVRPEPAEKKDTGLEELEADALEDELDAISDWEPPHEEDA